MAADGALLEAATNGAASDNRGSQTKEEAISPVDERDAAGRNATRACSSSIMAATSSSESKRGG